MRLGKFPNMLRNFPHGCNFRARQHGWNCSPNEGRRAADHCNGYSGIPRKKLDFIISNLGITPWHFRHFGTIARKGENAKVPKMSRVNLEFGVCAVTVAREENAPFFTQETLECPFRHSVLGGYRHALGGGEFVGQFRHHGKLHIGQTVLADYALHLCGCHAEILRQPD